MYLRATVVVLVAATACAPPGSGRSDAPLCEPGEHTGLLSDGLAESSGVAASRAYPGVYWTHNDSGSEPVIFAIDSTGAILARVRVEGATNVDWEDVALGPCPAGDCLYVADTGDNQERRDHAVIYRIPEPAPRDGRSAPAERFPFRFPDRPQDAEALFILPDPEPTAYIVTKGRAGPVTVYRYPPPFDPDRIVELEPVQTFDPGPMPLGRQVTGADATPDGRWVAIRSYDSLRFHPVDVSMAEPLLEPHGIALHPLREAQGEGVGLRPDGTVVLTGEAGPFRGDATIHLLRCRLP